MMRLEFAKKYVAELNRVLSELPWAELDRALAALEAAYDARRQVFIAGNGGSAATASHMANDLMLGVAKAGAPGFRVIALTDNVAALTAIGNDNGFEYLFEYQLRALAQPHDLLIVISGSGNSPNVLRAVQFAKESGLISVGFLGKDGGAARHACDISVVIPSYDYGPIEDAHMMLDHLITAYFVDRAAGRAAKRAG
jgi:D-sedoheptulose 7-phosphate isomerase